MVHNSHASLHMGVLIKRRGALGFLVLGFWLFFRLVFQFFFFTKKLRFWCSLQFADFPNFRIWFLVLVKNTKINGIFGFGI